MCQITIHGKCFENLYGIFNASRTVHVKIRNIFTHITENGSYFLRLSDPNVKRP